jgi:hypothetical protein
MGMVRKLFNILNRCVKKVSSQTLSLSLSLSASSHAGVVDEVIAGMQGNKPKVL